MFDHDSNPTWRLRITADIDDGRYFVWLDEHLVSLPFMRFTALLVLVRCRLTRSKGYAALRDFHVGGDKQLLHQTIRRTRRDFDDAIGANAGMALIRHQGASTYRLAVEPNQIEISRDLMELVPDHISEALARALLEPVSECQQKASALSSKSEYRPSSKSFSLTGANIRDQ